MNRYNSVIAEVLKAILETNHYTSFLYHSSVLSMAPVDLSKEVILLLLPTDIPEDYQARIKTKYPGIQIRWHNTLRPEGPHPRPEEIVPNELFQGVTILCARFLPTTDTLPRCHYVQLTAAGPNEHIKKPLYQRPNVKVCSANGVHPPQIAEWVRLPRATYPFTRRQDVAYALYTHILHYVTMKESIATTEYLFTWRSADSSTPSWINVH